MKVEEAQEDLEEGLKEKELESFLTKITAFIWAYSFTNPGVNALRTPVYAEMINIVNNKDVNFVDFKFEKTILNSAINNFEFKNSRPITKSMLAWWTFNNNNQELPSFEISFQIEHIFARKRQEIDKTLQNIKNLESIGNKSLLEEKINIRASDYRFSDKKNYYQGFTNSKKQYKEGSIISELKELAINKVDFLENDIRERNNNIINSFIIHLEKNELIK